MYVSQNKKSDNSQLIKKKAVPINVEKEWISDKHFIQISSIFNSSYYYSTFYKECITGSKLKIPFKYRKYFTIYKLIYEMYL